MATSSTSYPGVSGSNIATHGSIATGSTTLSVQNAFDFADGQGVRVNNAGPLAMTAAPTGLVVSPQGGTATTRYAYAIAVLNGYGGVSAASATAIILNGRPSLGPFTYNYLSWAPVSNAVGYAVYREIAGALTLIGFSASPAWNDFGATAISPPDWLPATAQASPLADWLVTSIVSGGGTTNLTLANAATTSQTGALVTHSDTAALQAWANDCSPTGCPLDVGTYQIEAPVTFSLATTLAGPGRALATIVQVNPFADAVRVVLSSGQAPTIRDFAIHGQTNTNAGTNLYISASSGEAYAAIIDHMSIYNGGYGVSFGAASQVRLTHSEIKGQSGASIVVANTNNADSGDSTIAENFISTGFGALADIYYVSSGGLRIVNNKLLSQPTTQYGILMSQTAGASSADLFIIGNSIEGQSIAAIWLTNGAGAVWSNIVINDNQWAGQQYGVYSNGTSANWPTNMTINGNISQLVSNGAVYLANATRVSVNGNVLAGTGKTGSVGVNVAASVNTGSVVGNIITGYPTSVVKASTTTLVASNYP